MVMKRSCALVVIASLLLLFISGCIDSSTTAPNTPPKAIIIALGSAIEGESADFDGTTSTASDGYIASYQWDFGDGQTGTGAKSPHIYSNAGTYVASLTVIDNHGLKDTDSIKIIVLKKTNSKPVAYGYITTITLDKMNTELIDVNDNYDKYEVEDNVGTINYRDYTYQTHRVTLWRNEAERIVNNVVAYELTTALTSSSGSKVFGYVTTIRF